MAKKYLDENGVRYIWQRFNQKLSDSTYETVIFTAKTNDNVNVATKVYVYTYTKRDSESAEDSLILTQTYNYTGGELTFQMPVGIKYKIEVDELEGYAAPEPKTYTAVARNIRNINYEYKDYITLTLNVIYPEDLDRFYHWSNKIRITYMDVDGSYKYIDEMWGTDIENGPNPFTCTVKLPPSKSPIEIVFTKIYHVKSPLNITFIPKYNSYTFDVAYEYMDPGVKIMDISGNLVDVDSWTNSMGVTGVAIITSNVSLVLAPNEWYSKNGSNPWNGNQVSAWGGADKILSNLWREEPAGSNAPNNFLNKEDIPIDGAVNTDEIISQLSGTSDGAPAAEYCRAYSNGCKDVGEWYLPSVKEAVEIYWNFSEVNEALNKISAPLLYGYDKYYPMFNGDKDPGMCTSNQYYRLDENGEISANKVYVVANFNENQSIANYIPIVHSHASSKSNPQYVRPVCHI